MNNWTKDPVMKLKLWSAIFAPLLYLAVCEFISRRPMENGTVFHGYAPWPIDQYNTLRVVLTIASAVSAVIFALLRFSIATGTPAGAVAFLLKPITEKTLDLDTATLQIMAVMLSTAANMAVLGLLLFFMNGIKADAYPFILGSFALNLFILPTQGMLAQISAIRKP